MNDIDVGILVDALKSVVIPKNDRLPSDPYKTLIQSVLSNEFSDQVMFHDRQPPAVEEFSDNSNTLASQLVSFGECGGYGLRHLAKLVSDVAITRSKDIIAALYAALGNPKAEAKTRGIEAVFLDVTGVGNCYSESLSQPSTHSYEVTLEAIVTNLKQESTNTDGTTRSAPGASFDDCIMVFVRRIMEEAFQADQSEDIITAEITAVMGSNEKNVQKIDVRSMKERRQQVLGILKAATVGEGEISMNIFLKIGHFLANYNYDSKGRTHHSHNITDTTLGYVRILRRYRFSYCDNNSNLKRCFARYPFESLARGVFLNANHAKTYREVYQKHLKNITQRQYERAVQSKDPGSRDKWALNPLDDKLFTSVYFMIIKKVKVSLDSGEYVHAGDWLMQLHSLMSPTKTTITFIIGRISQLCRSETGKLRSIRDALSSLRDVSGIIRRRIQDYVSKMAEDGDDDDDDDEYIGINYNSPRLRNNTKLRETDKELSAIFSHYKSIGDATTEIKLMLLSLIRDVHYSEFRYVSLGITLELWALFAEDKINPLVTPLKDRMTLEQELLQMGSILQVVDFHYNRLEDRLHVLESSMGMSILLNLIHKDIEMAEKMGELDFERFARELDEERNSYWLQSNFDEIAWKNRDVRFAERKWNQTPRSVWEILGYVQSYYHQKMELTESGSLTHARSADMKLNWYLDMNVSNGKVCTFEWDRGVTGKDIDALMNFVLFDPPSMVKKDDDSHYYTNKDKNQMAVNADGSKRVLTLFDVESILRCASGELVLTDMIHDEENRDETPKFLASEASRIRYLAETHAIRALHEGLYDAFTSKDVGGDCLLPLFSAVSQSLFKFSAYLHVWNDMPVSKIAQYVFAPARTTNGIRFSEECCGSSVVYSNYRPTPFSALKFISGGVFAPNRVLSALGYDIQEIFIKAWILPPVFFNMPASLPGIKVQTYVGLSVPTALQWGMPNYLTAINDAEEEAYTVAKDLEVKRMQGLSTGPVGPEHEEALKFKPSYKVVSVEYPVTPLEIEVVLKYHCEVSSGEQHARRAFGAELSKAVHYLSTGADWRLRNVEVFQDIKDSRKRRNDYSNKKFIFNASQILDDRNYDTMFQSAAGKYGFACIDGSVCIPEFRDELPTPANCQLDDSKSGDGKNKVLSLSVLAQALELSIKFQTHEGATEGYDPCGDDKERCSGLDGTASLCIQDYFRKKGYPRTFVPCRINFTLLSYVPVGKKTTKAGDQNPNPVPADDKSADTKDSYRNRNRGADKQTTEKEEEDAPGNLSIGNDHLPRLVASTVWLSPQAATGIWTCIQKAGDAEKCYTKMAAEYEIRHQIARSEGLFIDAIGYSKMASLLNLQYDRFVAYTRYNTSLAFTFNKLLQTIRMCRHLLEAEAATTMDIRAFRHTMIKYVCLGLRLCLLNPQCVHMRGGCQLILNDVLDLEGLIKIAPLPTKLTEPIVVIATAKNVRQSNLEESSPERWDENELRKALGQPSTVTKAAEILGTLEGKCVVMLDALATDIDKLLQEESFMVKSEPQKYLTLDPRDVVNSNQKKMQDLMDRTIRADDIIKVESIFDENGEIKSGRSISEIMRSTSTSTMTSATSLASLSESLIPDTIQENISSADDIEAEMREKLNLLLSKNSSLECVFGDLNDSDRRSVWIDREQEFAFTESGKLLAAKAVDAAAAAAAVALRNKKAEEKRNAAAGAQKLNANNPFLRRMSAVHRLRNETKQN